MIGFCSLLVHEDVSMLMAMMMAGASYAEPPNRDDGFARRLGRLDLLNHLAPGHRDELVARWVVL